MEADLSLAQSLGGLRIANPDGSLSPASSKGDSPARGTASSPPTSATAATSGSTATERVKSPLAAAPTLDTTDILRTSSPLDFNPGTFSAEARKPSIRRKLSPLDSQSPSAPIATVTSPASPTAGRDPPPHPATQRFPNRQSIPPTHQAQQHAHRPQYTSVLPNSHRRPARPVSAIYGPPSHSNRNPGAIGRYRSHVETTHAPRLSARAAATAMQAGVPSDEGQHTERVYRGNQTYTQNNQLPPRKSSRNLGTGPSNSPSASRHRTPTGQPYAIEGGPLQSSDEWQDRGAAVGMQKEVDANGKSILKQVKKGVKDFSFGRTLGEGSYSTVMAATDRQTGREYAIKILDKRHIIKEKKVKYVNIEKDTLNRLIDHPGVVRLYYTFQDEQSLYFVLDLCIGGELLAVLKRTTTFDEECTRFYGAEILDTIDYMHSRGVIHRDLKPENVLMDSHMHIKITDFGTAKLLDQRKATKPPRGDEPTGDPLPQADDNKANSFVGTAEYVSPELLTDKKACKASDLWAFGCIIYQLLAGRPPFKAGNEYLTFQKIVALEYKFPAGFPESAKDLVERLLVLDPASRLSIEHIKNHEFFQGITWGRGMWKQRAPKLKPFIPSFGDTRQASDVSNGNASSYPPNIAPSHSTSEKRFEQPAAAANIPRPNPRLVTDLPPPSQLDIEWSPVLTNANERILKMGNLVVNCVQGSQSPTSRGGPLSIEPEATSKFSRFFGSVNNTKKRQRLVMVTTSARIILAMAGGDEKKSKTEIELLGPSEATWSKTQDPKGSSYWSVDIVDKHYTFEDPKSSTSASCQDWLDVIERAREIALTQQAMNTNSAGATYTGSNALGRDTQSYRTLDLDAPPSSTSSNQPAASSLHDATGRHFLHKQPLLSPPAGAGSSLHTNAEEGSFLGRKRFSKRQSKSGLAAVF